ncbi:MAG: T9SS type A sorting domain-containing protein [Bacteroidetes bacterium]|nr:T9SS type A sorting domain-containing protein [Bacteroidota bacterium]MBL0256219.1 T9SS type A sorting domain-containing protein [Bacteroidota bacterium]
MFHIAYDSTTITSIVDRIDVLNDFIYPNPAKDYLKISVPIQKDMQATILSMQGEVILTIQNLQNEEEIHIEKLSAGMYLLNLKSSSGSHIFKFIKTE